MGVEREFILDERTRISFGGHRARAPFSTREGAFRSAGVERELRAGMTGSSRASLGRLCEFSVVSLGLLWGISGEF